MKVRMNVSMSGSEYSASVGDKIDMDPAEAKRLIKADYAVSLTQTKAEKAADKAAEDAATLAAETAAAAPPETAAAIPATAPETAIK